MYLVEKKEIEEVTYYYTGDEQFEEMNNFLEKNGWEKKANNQKVYIEDMGAFIQKYGASIKIFEERNEHYILEMKYKRVIR